MPLGELHEVAPLLTIDPMSVEVGEVAELDGVHEFDHELFIRMLLDE
jgi:hypothetical protein